MAQQTTTTAPAREAGARQPRSPSDFKPEAIQQISASLNRLLADTFALYVKTKNFHWHVSGPDFREYHKLLDDQSGQIYAMTDPIAERVRKIGGRTLHSIGEIARLQRLSDDDRESVPALDMLAQLQEDNKALAKYLRESRSVCEEHQDYASTSLIENWIDETEKRAWFLYEITRRPEDVVH